MTVWGDGDSTRDFCYIEDIATGIILAAESYNDSEPINLASGKETTIKEIATIIKNQIDYKGKILWDKYINMSRKDIVIIFSTKLLTIAIYPIQCLSIDKLY